MTRRRLLAGPDPLPLGSVPARSVRLHEGGRVDKLTTRTALRPAHELTISAAHQGPPGSKGGRCVCGWSTFAADSDAVAELFRAHRAAGQGGLF